jgi:hypothetical protein
LDVAPQCDGFAALPEAIYRVILACLPIVLRAFGVDDLGIGKSNREFMPEPRSDHFGRHLRISFAFFVLFV